MQGRLERADTVACVNLALRELFAAFVIHADDAPGPFDGGVLIEPMLRPGAVAPPSDPDNGWPWPAEVGGRARTRR